MNFLPGWSQFLASASDSLTVFALQASSESSSSSITAPADIQSGDLLSILDYSNGFSAPSAVTPSGFTNHANASGSNMRMMFSTKISDGTEASGSFTGMSAGGYGETKKIMAVFRGNASLLSLTPSTFNGQGTDSNPTSQNAAASGGTAPLIVFGCYSTQTGGSINPRTMSPAKDSEVGHSNNNLYLAWKVYLSAPADVSVDMDDEGSFNVLQSGYLELAV